MKQKLFIYLFLIAMVALLVALNAASYTQKEKVPDTELEPNRSTFNSGATGSQAFYTLLTETGQKVTRWQEPPAALSTTRNRPAVFVVIGSLRREFADVEIEHLLKWVSTGGRLVVIDREPPDALITTTADWKIVFGPNKGADPFGVDATDQKQMTLDTVAVRPTQPSVFTHSINAVQPSRFASSISIEHFEEDPPERMRGIGVGADPPPPKMSESKTDRPPAGGRLYTLPSPTPADQISFADQASSGQISPVVHFAQQEKNLVVDAPFGNGRIVFVADPYLVSNGGIGLVDNAQLAINLVAAGDKLVAFDEYHQGYGSENNRLFQFFEGTPVIALFLQTAVLITFVFFSQSRRFARPVPALEPDRLSKLEYVAAMAELQNRTGAFDLAVENIYNDFRRRASRYFGLDNFTAKSGELARLISERTGLDSSTVESVLFKCEEIIRGEPTGKREVLALTDSLRMIEQKLGIARASRNKS